MLRFEELWRRLVELAESVEIEVKTGEHVGVSALETVSAFSNEPGFGGGYVIFGVRQKSDSPFPDYEVVGVDDADQLQADLAMQCRITLNSPVRPDIVVEMRGDRRVVIVFVPEAQPQDKPIYITARGLPKGAFRRIGSTDQKCTDDDIALFYQSRQHASFDSTPIAEADLSDIDPKAIASYRDARRETNPNAAELDYTDDELLAALGCVANRPEGPVLTLAGLVLFGKHSAMRRLYSMMRVDYIRVAGTEWVPSPDERFESIDILGSLFHVIPRAINAILDDIPKAFRLPAGENRRRDIPVLPRAAVREAVVNAVMHRSYRQRQPIQIIRYSNRLEIRNPGHSLVPDDRLGEPGSLTRNERIAAVLHETNYAETKGSGIRAMRAALSDAGLSPPTFESDRGKDCFVVTFLFHHFLNADDVAWLGKFSNCQLSEDEAKALVFVRETGAINNAAYRDLNRVDTLVASGHLRRLRDLGLLNQKGMSVGTYYLPTERLTERESKATDLAGSLSMGVDSLSTRLGPLSRGFDPYDKESVESPDVTLSIPADLRRIISSIGQRTSKNDLRTAIRKLCAWKSLSGSDLATLLRRDRPYLTQAYLTPMVREGELEWTIPATPSHPEQKYRSKGA
jgi:ATP-dependent DNA helicase RecG